MCETEREMERERETELLIKFTENSDLNSNLKTLFYKDCRV